VKACWGDPNVDLDACRCIDQKLRRLANGLKSWRASCVGDVHLQLAASRAVIYELDTAQESRELSHGERDWLRELKAAVLGLSSLARTMARQCARIKFLRGGDARTKYFHLMACHRKRKNHLFALLHNGQTFTEDEAKAGIVHSYSKDLLGTPFQRAHRIDLSQLDLPRADLSELALAFSAAEVAKIVQASPTDRAPRPDGFTAGFLKAAWPIVAPDVVRVERS